MGEYASHNGREIKIGTCESMYYLRADQATSVRSIRGNVDPIRDSASLLFRFPFPDEDAKRPGDFEPFRAATLSLPGFISGDGYEHGNVQLTMSGGYMIYVPCPESGWVPNEGKWQLNGHPGNVKITFQRVWNGHLATVVSCAGCDRSFRLPELSDAEALIVAVRAMADRYQRDAELSGGTVKADSDSRAVYWHKIADRIATGYTDPPAWVLATKPVLA